MKYAYINGFKVIDFGATKKDSTLHLFKRRFDTFDVNVFRLWIFPPHGLIKELSK